MTLNEIDIMLKKLTEMVDLRKIVFEQDRKIIELTKRWDDSRDYAAKLWKRIQELTAGEKDKQ